MGAKVAYEYPAYSKKKWCKSVKNWRFNEFFSGATFGDIFVSARKPSERRARVRASETQIRQQQQMGIFGPGR